MPLPQCSVSAAPWGPKTPRGQVSPGAWLHPGHRLREGTALGSTKALWLVELGCSPACVPGGPGTAGLRDWGGGACHRRSCVRGSRRRHHCSGDAPREAVRLRVWVREQLGGSASKTGRLVSPLRERPEPHCTILTHAQPCSPCCHRWCPPRHVAPREHVRLPAQSAQPLCGLEVAGSQLCPGRWKGMCVLQLCPARLFTSWRLSL